MKSNISMLREVISVVTLFICAASCQGGFDKEKSHPILHSLKRYQIVKPSQFIDEDFKTKSDHINTLLDGSSKTHQKRAFFVLEFNGTSHMIDMSLNDNLFSHTFEQTFDTMTNDVTSKETNNDVINHCYYHGVVRGITGSHVTASTCNGGLRATIYLPDNTFIIEPLLNVDHQHVLYDRNDYAEPEEGESCGNGGVHKIEHAFEDISGNYRHKRAVDSDRKVYLELMLVADKTEADKYRSRLHLSETMKSMVNHVALLYRELNVIVVFSHLEVWDSGDRIASSRDSLQVLNEFQKYRTSNIRRKVDSVQLIYGGNFRGNTVGHANSQSVCTNRAVGVTMGGGPFRIERVATTLAHEIGHNLGMGHDSRGCRCPSRNCIMSAVSNNGRPAREWSSCSELALDRTLDLGYGSCLYNVPNTENTYGGIQCGNKIVEKGEECDCGTPGECTSSCCNARTCKLVAGAKCDSGSCCSNCQYQRPGHECRKRNGPCDLPEYCTGTTSACPNDFHAEDGLSCNDRKSLCYDGECVIPDNTCRRIWGAGSEQGPDICFDLINRRGDQRGNCGFDGRIFIRCSRGNEECGKLHCIGGRDTPVISATYASTGFRLGRTVTDCKYLWSDRNKPNLIPNGSKCGTNGACNNGECLPIARSACSCNGNGVCNNEGNCHCNTGWAPPNCDTPGSGGSINSGNVESRIRTAPEGLVASEVTTHSIQLKWLPIVGATGYIVNLTSKDYYKVETILGKTNVNFIELRRGTPYMARVQAFNRRGNSPTARLRIRTLNADAPTRVKALATSPTSVKVSWKRESSADWYNVELVDTSNNNVVITKHRITDDSAEIYGLESSKTYEVQVTVTERHLNSVDRFASYTSLPTSTTVYLRCQLPPLDFLFVYDISGETEPENFVKVKDFMADFLQQFPALNKSDPSATRVAAIKYSTRTSTIFNYNRFGRTPNVVGALKYIRYGGGPAYAGRMVEFVYSDFFGVKKTDLGIAVRPEALQITIIYSGGRSSDSISPSTARRLRFSTNVFSVGIQGKSVRSDLRLLASTPDHIFTAPSYDQMNSLTIDMQKKMCEIDI